MSDSTGSVLRPTKPIEYGAGRMISIREDMTGYVTGPLNRVCRVGLGIILLHDADGCSSTHTVAFADRLGEQGFIVLVPDLYSCSFTQNIEELNFDVLVERMNSSIDYLSTLHVQNFGCIGMHVSGKYSIQVASRIAAFTCSVALSPVITDCVILDSITNPTLIVIGDQENLQNDVIKYSNIHEEIKIVMVKGQAYAFCESSIIGEDVATQSIAETIDFFHVHLGQLKPAAMTSDGNPWWPQGRNGPFVNVGLRNWLEVRSKWVSSNKNKQAHPDPVSLEVVVKELSATRRTYDLPGPMTLADVVEILVEIWSVET